MIEKITYIIKEKDKEINMIKAGIIGSTGYAGQELVRILTQHKDAEVVWLIGATSIIGNNVKLYQGVTLGAKSFPLDADGKPIKGIPRHPILEDNVIVYSNATILGRITIGRDATVGGNIWVTENVPAGARIVQTKAKK